MNWQFLRTNPTGLIAALLWVLGSLSACAPPHPPALPIGQAGVAASPLPGATATPDVQREATEPVPEPSPASVTLTAAVPTRTLVESMEVTERAVSATPVPSITPVTAVRIVAATPATPVKAKATVAPTSAPLLKVTPIVVPTTAPPQSQPAIAETAPQTSILPQPAANPVRLRIPAIGVDAAVEAVGKTSSGNMDVPARSDDVAWYSPGTLPGEPGNAVMAGHLDDTTGAPSVFWKLSRLHVGDKISVVDSGNSEHTFAVVATASYPIDQAPLIKIFGYNPERALNLITCTGTWNSQANGYSNRLVVYARLLY